MSPRLKLRAAASPLVLAGVLWGSATPMADAFGPHTQTPPPCSPDGACLPKWDTYGFYQARWRPFPGDAITAAPTPAGDEGEPQPGDDLGGPQPPSPSRESALGPIRPSREAAEGAPGAEGAAPAPGAGDVEGLPGLQDLGPPTPLPSTEDAPPAGGLPGGGTLDGAPPAGNDPFGARRPAPPAWLRNPQSVQVRLERLPEIDAPRAANESIQPRRQPVVDGPNLHGDDAPPALPASLQRLSQHIPHEAPTWTPGALNVLPPVIQPASVREAVDRRVTPASGEDPYHRQVVPAVAGPENEGLPDQALYIEASDQPVALPPID